MPIYEYECRACKCGFELLMRSDMQDAICPYCQSNNTQRKVSATAFQLKGDGWFKDGYGKKATDNNSSPNTKE